MSFVDTCISSFPFTSKIWHTFEFLNLDFLFFWFSPWSEFTFDFSSSWNFFLTLKKPKTLFCPCQVDKSMSSHVLCSSYLIVCCPRHQLSLWGVSKFMLLQCSSRGRACPSVSSFSCSLRMLQVILSSILTLFGIFKALSFTIFKLSLALSPLFSITYKQVELYKPLKSQ